MKYFSQIKLEILYLFIYFVGLEFELRASHLQSRVLLLDPRLQSN
jgi:hypothetical protein